MIKKAYLAVIVGVMLMITPSGFCQEAASPPEPNTIFQLLGDLINGKYKAKVEPYKTIDVFQVVADDIRRGH